MTPKPTHQAPDPREIEHGVFGWLESPGPSDDVVDCVIVSGWAFDRAGPFRNVRVEGLGPTVNISSGLERTDVGAAYPNDPMALLSGFSGFVEIDPLKSPRHIEIWATCHDGAPIRLFRRRILSSNGSESRTPAARFMRDAVAYTLADPQTLVSRAAWAHGFERFRNLLRPLRREAAATEGGNVPNDAATVALQQFLQSALPFRFPSASLPQVSIVLVLWNRAELTLRCLRALSDQAGVASELIIVDNNSTDDTARLLDLVRGARILHNTQNAGFTVAANQGARAARGEFVLFVNSDAEPLPASLSSLIETISGSDSIGAVGGKLVFPTGVLQEAGSIVWSDGSCEAYGRGHDPSAPEYNFERDVDFCSGAFLLTRRETFTSLGGFDERYKPAYYEDADYCVRLWKQGLKVVYQPRAVALHHEFGSAMSRARSISLQIERRDLFSSLHRDWLAGQALRERGLLVARSRPIGRPTVLVIDDMLPEPRFGAGFPRAAALLRTLDGLGFGLAFYPTTNAAQADTQRRFGRVEVVTPGGAAVLRAFLASRRGHLDAVIVSRSHNMRLLKAAIGNDLTGASAPVLYDAEALSATRQIGQRRLQGVSIAPEEVELLLRNETRLASGCAAVIAVNSAERQHFVDAGVSRCVVLGHALEPKPTPATFAERTGILFVGALSASSPNEDAVLFLADDVLPLVRRSLGADVPVTVAGANVSERVRSLADRGLSVWSDMEDLTPLYNGARVFVAPTRFSAGIPLKVLEAASRGVPVVCTGLLAEQLGWRAERDALIADTAEGLALAIERLLCDADLWERLRASALNRIAVDCNPESFRSTVAGVLEDSLARQQRS